jgi:hypothetical protein
MNPRAPKLAHEVIFQSGADGWSSLVKQVFRTDEPHHAVDQEWLEDAGNAVARLERDLIAP